MAHSSERTGYSLSADLFKDDAPTHLDQKITDLVDQFSDDAIFGAIEDRLNFAIGVASLREEIKRTCSNRLEATHLVRTLHGTVAEKISDATERAIAEQRVTEATFESLRALPVPISALQPHIYRFYDKAVKAQSVAAAETRPVEKVTRMNEAEDVTMVAVSMGRDIPEERKGSRVVERSGVEVHAEWVLQARKDVKQSNSREKLDGVRGVLVTAYGHDLRQQPLAKDIGKVAAAVAITGLMTAAPVSAAQASVRVEKQENLPSPQAHEEITDLSKPIKLTTVTKPADKEVVKEVVADSPTPATPAEAVSAPIVVSLPEKTSAANEAKKETKASPVKEETSLLEDGPIRISMPDVTAALPKKKAPATDAVTISHPDAPKAAEAPAPEDDQTMITTLFPEGPLRISRSDIHIEHKPQDDTSDDVQIILPPSAELPPTPPAAQEPKVPEAAPKPEAPAPAPTPETMTDQQQFSLAAQKLMDRGGEWTNRGRLMKIFIDSGEMTPMHAAAFIGNFMVEAPGLDPATRQGYGGPGRGFVQWGNDNPAQAEMDRFGYDGTRGLVKFAKDRGTSWDDFDTEALFVLHELKTTEKHAYDIIMSTKTREEATLAVSKFYERPGEPHNDRRVANANILAQGYNEELKAIRAAVNPPAAPSLEITTISQRENDGKVGDIPYAYQLDPRWANMPLPDGTGPIGPVACNPTSLSMVAMAIGDKSATPDKVYARYIADNRIGKDGAHQQSLLDLAPAFGLRANLIPNNDIEVFKKVIKDGGKIILSGNTNGRLLPNPGHFVVVYGISESGNMLIADPGNPKNNGHEFSLQDQINASNSIRARLGTTNAGLHYNAVALYHQ